MVTALVKSAGNLESAMHVVHFIVPSFIVVVVIGFGGTGTSSDGFDTVVEIDVRWERGLVNTTRQMWYHCRIDRTADCREGCVPVPHGIPSIVGSSLTINHTKAASAYIPKQHSTHYYQVISFW